MCDGIPKWEIQLAPSGQMGTWVKEGIRVAEVDGVDVDRLQGGHESCLDRA